MKEFRSRNSGRYIFNEDIHNLQNLALSMTEMFKDSGVDFVISGCGITVTQDNGVYTVSVGNGFVFIDNKVREVAAFTGTTSAINTIGLFATTPVAPQITYVSGDTDYQYNDFAAEVRLNSEETNGRLLAVLDGGVYKFPNLKTGYFAHYCILNNGTAGHLDSLVAGEIDATTLKIGSTNVNSLFVKKDGDTMNNGATLTFTNGSKSTIIGPASLSVGGSISGETLSLSGAASVGGNLTAAAIIKSGGLSTEFLKADGSVDDTDYATSDDLANYLPLTGGTLTGNLTCNVNLNVSGNASVLGNITVSTNLNVQGTISGVNETLTGNLNAKDGAFTGDINAHDSTFTGKLVADSAEITNGFTAGTITVNGVATIGGALTTSSTATIGGDTTITGEVTATKLIKSGGTSAQFLKADGSVDSNTYATSNSLGNYLPLSGGTLTGDLTCQTKVTSNSFIVPERDGFLKADGTIDDSTYLKITTNGTVAGNLTANGFIKSGGTSSQFLKADGSVDNNTYALSSALGNYLPLSGGTLTGALTCQTEVTASSFIKTNGTSSQFLKADGSVDSNTYVTTSALTTALSNVFSADGGTIYNDDYYIGLTGSGIVLGHLEGQATLALTPIDRNLGISARALEINCATTISSSITATSFVKSGGTSSQFLKADGSVDSNTYVTSSALSNYLSSDGGTMYSGDNYVTIGGGGITIGHMEGQATLALTAIDRNLGISAKAVEIGCNTSVSGSVTASSFIKSGGTSSQFLKADGSVDSNTYVTSSALNNYLSADGGTMHYGDYYLTLNGGGITLGHLEGQAKLYLTSIDRYLGIQAGRLDVNCNTIVNGSITATSLVKSGGTSSQFLKADGSVDKNTYATASSLSNYVTQSALNSTLSSYAHSSDLNNYMSLDDGGTIYSSDHYVTIRGNGITIGHLEGSTTLSVTAIDRDLGINNNVVVSGTVTATSFPTSSDERLKSKISNVLLTAEQIANAPAINFKYKDGDQSIHAGTIAQYWQEILPAVIMGKSDRLTMDYGPAAMVAVINLAKEVVALKQEISRLSN